MHSDSMRRNLLVILGIIGVALPASLRAEEVPTRFGIFGVFSPDRRQDLRDVLADVPELELAQLDYDKAEVTFRYDMQKLFPNSNPKKPPKADEVFQRVNNLLTNASHASFRLRPLSTTPADKLTKLEIDIGVLDCKACRYGAYRTVMQIDGVERATVSSEPSRITAWIEGEKTNRAALETALKKAGVGLPGK